MISWNIQWGRGCDGVVDLRRIVRHARALADFDVLCLQEVASNYPGLPGIRRGNEGEDQPALLAKLLPAYTPVFCAATDVRAGDGSRRLFGNMILSRLPVTQAFRHLLPWPAEARRTSMQRALVEAIVMAPFGALRVMTTHLEYYSPAQRRAQVERIRELHAAAALRARVPTRDASRGPFRTFRGTASAVLAGDFNFRPSDPLHARLAAPFSRPVPAFRDAWEIVYPGAPHPPSIGVFDRRQWPRPYCCDFVYVTEDLRDRVLETRIDQQSDASDHQPVLLVLY
ncbi:MAG TPA: endonuclease/exonuclease/phosphatase family protein [Burkholderiales bacterium]|nr:endonuclease/exonuclease/phosphatase family protein [Burkholderiales bacterium]